MFAYCNNDPINCVDSEGTRVCLNNKLMSNDGGGTYSTNGNVSTKKQPSKLSQFLNNTDEDAVYNASHFAFYNGVLVIRHSNDYLTSWAYGGVIFLNHSYDTLSHRDELLRHEYGHILQEKDLGTISYTFQVFIPSATYNVISRGNQVLYDLYYYMPWEYDANMRGGANLGYSNWAEVASDIYFWFWDWSWIL